MLAADAAAAALTLAFLFFFFLFPFLLASLVACLLAGLADGQLSCRCLAHTARVGHCVYVELPEERF